MLLKLPHSKESLLRTCSTLIFKQVHIPRRNVTNTTGNLTRVLQEEEQVFSSKRDIITPQRNCAREDRKSDHEQGICIKHLASLCLHNIFVFIQPSSSECLGTSQLLTSSGRNLLLSSTQKRKGELQQIKGLTQFTCLGIKMQLCVNSLNLLYAQRAASSKKHFMQLSASSFVVSSVLDAIL